MNILFLDDCQTRINEFLEAFPDARIVSTAGGAIAAINSEPWDVICLDHDLGDPLESPYAGRVPVIGSHGVTVDSEPIHGAGCGMDVVRHLCDRYPWAPAIIVHSWNIGRARVMCADLIAAGLAAHQCPFGPMMMDVVSGFAPKP